MDDLDLEKLKQELNDVSGGSLYDVDEIMREAGSDASDGSGTSLEALMKSLGVEVEEPETQPVPEKESKTEAMKTQFVPKEEPETESLKTQIAGEAAPVAEEMMPELTVNDDLAALFLAAEQTQALVEEQEAMTDDASEEAEEPDPLEEQDNVFAQLFAQLGAIEQEEKPTDPRITEPIHELDEEPDLMARLFRKPDEEPEMESSQPQEDATDVHTNLEPLAKEQEETAETKQFEAVLDQATKVLEKEEAEADDEEELDDESEEIEEETEEPDTSDEEEDTGEQEALPKRSFFSRLFGVSDDDDDDDDDEDDFEDEEEDDLEEDDESDDEDELEEIDETQVYEPEEEAEEDELDEEDDSGEEEDEIEERPKRSFFTRLFGASEEDDDDEDDEDDFEDEEEDDFEEEDEFEEEDDESGETDVTQAYGPEAEPEDAGTEDIPDLDETQAFDALAEQETQKIEYFETEEVSGAAASVAVEDEIAEKTMEVVDEAEETGAYEQEEELDEADDSDEEEDVEEQPKKSFFSRLLGAFEDEGDEEDDTDEEDEFEEDDEAEEAGVTHVYEPEEETAEESGDLWEEADEAIQDSETDIDMLEQLPEEDSVAADFKETLEREEEIEAKEAKLTMPQPRPEDTPVISEEELAEFLSDVDEEEEEKEHVSFEQLLRDNGVALEEDKPKQPKISLEEFPEEETMVYVDIPIREPSPEEADKPHQPELFDAEAEMEKESETPDEEPEEPAGVSEEEQEEPIPESDPDWLNVPLEELCKTAPALEQLRQEGPVMAREVLRQKEWIMERFRRYQDEERRAQMPEEELDEEPETEPQKPEDEPEELDAIHAADELHALLEQEENENDSVFHDGPTGKPETEAAGQKESIIEVTVAVPEAEEPAELEEELAEREEQPAEQPKQKSERPKPDREKASWPQEAVPEDLNKESKRYRIRAGKQARRASVIAVLTLICIYISCAADFAILPLPDSMNYAYHPSNVLTAFLVLMGISILLAYDVIWEGVQALIHLRPNMSTLIDLALALNVIHCVIRLISEGEEIPYACIAMLSLFAQMRAQVSKSTIRHYTYKVAGNARQPMGLFYHGGPQPHIVKAPLENTDVFIAQTLQRGKRQRDETIFTMMSAIVALVLSVIVCTATGDTGRLIYVLAATVTGACQIALICAMVMARSHTARRMLRGGTAADDNIGIERLAKTQTIVLTDEDLFPANSIALERLELRSNLNDSTALAYAAALTGGSSLGSMLAEEVRTRYGAPLMARHVVHDVHGGVSGQIGGLQVMLGDDRYMAEHGVITSDVPENGLILALDGNVAAVMVIDYQVPAALFNAMQVLTEKKTTIWLHTRNHQVTPKLVEQKYALKEGTVIVPEMETDRALSSPHYTDKDLLCGLVMRDGFVPMSGCITAARVEARISPAGIIIGACVSLLCVLLMTYLCYVFVPSDAHPIRVLIYMILCFIPIFFLENGIDKE